MISRAGRPSAGLVAAGLLVMGFIGGCASSRPATTEPLDAEGQALAALPPRSDLDSYRSWIGPAPIEPPPVGFSARRIGDRWWLVAPSGRLYWASALHRAGCGLEPDKPITPYRDALLRKWGQGLFGMQCPRRVLDRLVGWGFTAIGLDSSDILFGVRALPFLTGGLQPARLVIPLAAPGIPDPFSGDLAIRFASALSPLAGWRDAPFCLGHPAGVSADWNGLAAAVLALPAKAPAKAEWLKSLREAYGKIADLRRAWGVSATSFETVRWPGDAKATDIAKADLEGFRGRLADMLYGSIEHSVRVADRSHLIFGLAVVPGETPPDVVSAIVRHSDVVVVRVGMAEPALPAIEEFVASVGKPVYVVASAPATGGPAVLAASWTRVMERLAANPGIVGAEISDYLPNADGTSFVGWDDALEALLCDVARKTNERILRLHAGMPEPAPAH